MHMFSTLLSLLLFVVPLGKNLALDEQSYQVPIYLHLKTEYCQKKKIQYGKLIPLTNSWLLTRTGYSVLLGDVAAFLWFDHICILVPFHFPQTSVNFSLIQMVAPLKQPISPSTQFSEIALFSSTSDSSCVKLIRCILEKINQFLFNQ